MSLTYKEVQIGISQIHRLFSDALSKCLNLCEVDAPLVVTGDTGLNDLLNDVERVVQFDAKDMDVSIEIVQSLAKWKRYALNRYGFSHGEGIYTNMIAIRRDEDISDIHSITVRQWDWEKIISRSERTVSYLNTVVRSIYRILVDVQTYVSEMYPNIYDASDKWIFLPQDIHFISTQELEDLYPEMNSKERENAIAYEKGAVFLYQIGDKLLSGNPHDGRSAEYDDWSLNGDIIVWNSVIGRAFEISSMGIRVDAESLRYQCKQRGIEDRLSLPYHQSILNNSLPLTIGGGIGQSRVYMYMLRRHHIGEVQSSVWPLSMTEKCTTENVLLL